MLLLASVPPPLPSSLVLAPSMMAMGTAAAAFLVAGDLASKPPPMASTAASTAAAEATPRSNAQDWRPAAIGTLLPLMIALALPGGMSFAASFPLLLWFRAWSPPSETPPLPGVVEWCAAVAISSALCTLEGGLFHVDTGSQGGSVASSCISLALAVSAAQMLPSPNRSNPNRSPGDDRNGKRAKRARGGDQTPVGDRAPLDQRDLDDQEQRRRALSKRKSWDARLQWQLRRKREQLG